MRTAIINSNIIGINGKFWEKGTEVNVLGSDGYFVDIATKDGFNEITTFAKNVTIQPITPNTNK